MKKENGNKALPRSDSDSCHWLLMGQNLLLMINQNKGLVKFLRNLTKKKKTAKFSYQKYARRYPGDSENSLKSNLKTVLRGPS